MKLENTIENKARFFALYFNQKVFTHVEYKNDEVDYVTDLSFGFMRRDGKDNKYLLELKPLSSITEEDAIGVCDLLGHDKSKSTAETGRKVLETRIYSYKTKNADFILEIFDFLRSKGYALPYLGAPVETLQSWGWIKLKED